MFSSTCCSPWVMLNGTICARKLILMRQVIFYRCGAQFCAIMEVFSLSRRALFKGKCYATAASAFISDSTVTCFTAHDLVDPLSQSSGNKSIARAEANYHKTLNWNGANIKLDNKKFPEAMKGKNMHRLASNICNKIFTIFFSSILMTSCRRGVA